MPSPEPCYFLVLLKAAVAWANLLRDSMLLRSLPIPVHCQRQHHHSFQPENPERLGNIAQIRPFQHNPSHDVNEMPDGVGEGEVLGPVGHALNRREEAAQQDENHDEKPGDEHRLLLAFGDG